MTTLTPSGDRERQAVTLLLLITVAMALYAVFC
jgi:hypothetical protein